MLSAVREWLAWPKSGTPRLAELEDIDIAPMCLPPADEGAELMVRFGVAGDAIEEMVANWPDPDRTPEAWWLLERLAAHVVHDDGRPPPWPSPEPSDDPLERYFHLYAYLACVPALFQRHARRRIPDDIVWDTLTDVGLQVSNFRDRHGRPGFDGAFWVWDHFRGDSLKVGRFLYELRAGPGPSMAADFRAGECVVGVHIPSAGPLTPEATDASFARLGPFLAEHYPDRDYRYATCESWLLDPQLSRWLPADSNIVRFQRRFCLLEDKRRDGDHDVGVYVLDAVTPDGRVSSLQRAARAHYEDGGHFEIRFGWRRI